MLTMLTRKRRQTVTTINFSLHFELLVTEKWIVWTLQKMAYQIAIEYLQWNYIFCPSAVNLNFGCYSTTEWDKLCALRDVKKKRGRLKSEANKPKEEETTNKQLRCWTTQTLVCLGISETKMYTGRECRAREKKNYRIMFVWSDNADVDSRKRQMAEQKAEANVYTFRMYINGPSTKSWNDASNTHRLYT